MCRSQIRDPGRERVTLPSFLRPSCSNTDADFTVKKRLRETHHLSKKYSLKTCEDIRSEKTKQNNMFSNFVP